VTFTMVDRPSAEREHGHEHLHDEAPPAITDATPPFGPGSPWGADVILRSSDNVDFHVLKAPLAYSSPIFKTMFTLPRGQQLGSDVGDSMVPVDDTKDGLPIVTLSESGEVLHRLLHLCYLDCATTGTAAAKTHTLEHLLPELEHIPGVLGAAMKYGMDAVEKRVRQELIAPRFLEREPLLVFTLAVRHKLEAEARAAARMTLAVPETGSHFPPEMDTITANDFRRLLHYQRRCAEKASWVTTHLEWIHANSSWIWFKCGTCKNPSPKGVTIASSQGPCYKVCSAWWSEYMDQAAKALEKKPVGATVIANDLMDKALGDAGKCDSCRHRAFAQMRRFGDLFAAEVDRAISEVWTLPLANFCDDKSCLLSPAAGIT
jgi:hypothetical protein